MSRPWAVFYGQNIRLVPVVRKLGKQLFLDIFRHGPTQDQVRPQFHGRCRDQVCRQGNNVEVVIQMSSLTTMLGVAGGPRMARSPMADPTEVASVLRCEEDIGAEIDALCRALETPAGLRERPEIHGGLDRDEQVGVLRHELRGRQ